MGIIIPAFVLGDGAIIVHEVCGCYTAVPGAVCHRLADSLVEIRGSFCNRHTRTTARGRIHKLARTEPAGRPFDTRPRNDPDAITSKSKQSKRGCWQCK